MNIGEANAVNHVLDQLTPAQRRAVKQDALVLVTKANKVLGAGLRPSEVEKW